VTASTNSEKKSKNKKNKRKAKGIADFMENEAEAKAFNE